MKVELNEQAKQELIYIQNYFKSKTGTHRHLGHYANIAVNELYNHIRSKGTENAEEQNQAEQ